MAPADLLVLPTDVRSAAKYLLNVLTAPLWFFDAVDKEKVVMSLPYAVRRFLLKALFYPTLFWTMLLHRVMPNERRWFDRVDSRVIIGALPLRRRRHEERVLKERVLLREPLQRRQ